MIVSAPDLLEMRSLLLAIPTEQWMLLLSGWCLGALVWVSLSRMLQALNDRFLRTNNIELVEGLAGAALFVGNAFLLYVATSVASFFLFAFAFAGALAGASITIPAGTK